VRALIIEHDHVSPPGAIGERLAAHGYQVDEFLVVPSASFASPAVAVELPDLSTYDVVVPMGAKWSVDDVAAIGPWVTPELAALRAAHEAGTAILGICFGGQALAVALGGSVERAPAPEIGWGPVDAHGDVVGVGPWFQFHFDRFTPPPGSTLLASNASCAQAFVLGRSLGVQFHPEISGAMLQGWYDNGGRGAVTSAGLDADELLAQTYAEEAGARLRGHTLVDRFLSL
jgi:GMP synthase-like glutamine amidotransferase